MGALVLVKIAVIDDEQMDREFMLDSLARYGRERHVLLETEAFESGEAFLQKFEQDGPPGPSGYSIIFLDIYLTGMSGMETARRIRGRDSECLLVFCTASDSHAVDSYRVRAFDYLVKPYGYEQLSEVMQLCDKTLLSRAHYIEIRQSRVLVRVPLVDILYVDYYKHYVQVHTKQNLYRSYMPFADIAQSLLPYHQFLCCYRNLMINLDEVASMEDKEFVMKNGERIPMARNRRTLLRQRYADYVLEKLERRA